MLSTGSLHRIVRRFIILMIGIFSFQASGQTNAEQVLTIGRNVLSMDDYLLAIQYFNLAIKAKPYLSEPYFYRAIAKLYLDDLKGAEEDCTLSIERNAFKPETYKVRGIVRQQMGLDSLAIIDYETGLKYNPSDKYFLFYKGLALTDLNKYSEADTVLSEVISRFPTFEEGYEARGRLNMLNGDTIAAVEDINKALSISQSRINPYLMLAEIEWNRKNWDRASEAISEAIKLKPENPDLYVNRAFIRYNSDNFFGAMQDYNYALELDPENIQATFNRGLLRYEVKDLERAEADFSRVLELDPGNFYALYNRGLVRLESNKNKEALEDFKAISEKYPRFYPVYYAIGEAYRNMGNMREAMASVHHADELVEKYVENPDKFTLDRPAIAASKSNSVNHNEQEEEDPKEFLEKFNRLMTVSHSSQAENLTYNERIKGRVQDRDVTIEPIGMFSFSFMEPSKSLNPFSNSFKELDDINRLNLVRNKIYITSDEKSGANAEEYQKLFALADDLGLKVSNRSTRPIDYFAYGIALSSLKNYEEALNNFEKAVSLDPRFAMAFIASAVTRYEEAVADLKKSQSENPESSMLEAKLYSTMLQEAVNDLDKALNLNPGLTVAWFDKGNIYLASGDYAEAIRCFDRAINLDPDLGQGYFNRGLAYMHSGNKEQSFADLSKAGELGVLQSYNILKRMQ